jgi:hypothetical protein
MSKPTALDGITAALELAGDDVITRLNSISDPVERQAAARTVLETLLPALVRDVKANRAETVAQLKEGRTLAEVGQLLGNMSVARVDQILKAGRK